MAQILVDQAWDLFTLLGKIEEMPGNAVSLDFPEGHPLLRNILNLKFLKRESQKLGKKVSFTTRDPAGRNLIEALENGGVGVRETEKFGFVVGRDVAPPVGKRSRLREIGARLATINFGFLRRPRFLATGVVITGGVLLLVGGLFFLYFSFPRAEVQLVVGSEVLVKSVEVQASSSATQMDIEGRVLPAVSLEVERRGSLSRQTTGTRTVGNKATGVVTIYNKTDEEKTLAGGAILSFARPEGDNLRYTLDSTVTVPARVLAEASSTPAETTTTYVSGKAEVAVTAEEIGEEYNLPAGSTLSVAGLSTDDFVAQNEEAFSGGLSREVAVVSDSDQTELRRLLSEDLQSQALSALRSKTVGDQRFEESAVFFEVLEEEYDKAVGEEAEKLALKMRILAKTLIYSEKDLQTLLEHLLSEFVPAGFELSESEKKIEVAVSEADLGEGIVKFQAKVSGYVMPIIDEEELREILAGKRVADADSYLKTLPNIESSKITLFPNLPEPLRRMPIKPSRIKILLLRR